MSASEPVLTGVDAAKAWSRVLKARSGLAAAAADLFAIAPTAPPSVTGKLVQDIALRQAELEAAYTMSERLSDHDLNVLVESAARGVIDSEADMRATARWDDLDGASKNTVREMALGFILHGTKALGELGYVKPRTITTEAELDALPIGAVVVDVEPPIWMWMKWWESKHPRKNGTPLSKWSCRGYDDDIETHEVPLPVTVLWEPK